MACLNTVATRVNVKAGYSKIYWAWLLRDLWFSQRFCWRLKSSGILGCVVMQIFAEVPNYRIAFGTMW